jgi:hypothetical protein
MVFRWLVVALAIGAAAPAAAMAVDKGVVLDRDSPVEKEYSLPLDAQRVGLSGLSDSVLHAGAVRAGLAAPASSAAPGPLFGFGVQSPAARRAALRSDLEALARRSDEGVLASTLPAAQRVALIAAGRVAARVPDTGVLGGGGGVAAVVVLLAGALGGLALRRLRLI